MLQNIVKMSYGILYVYRLFKKYQESFNRGYILTKKKKSFIHLSDYHRMAYFLNNYYTLTFFFFPENTI